MTTNMKIVCLAACVALGTKASGQQPKKPFSDEIRQAWEKTGAKAGWMSRGSVGTMVRFEMFKSPMLPGQEGPDYLPAFRGVRWKPGLYAELPEPNKPFGLDLEFTGAKND